jgi:hypothetical protein
MTQETMVQEITPNSKEVTTKTKVLSVIRWVFLGAMIGLLLFTVVMAAYRKFSG